MVRPHAYHQMARKPPRLSFNNRPQTPNSTHRLFPRNVPSHSIPTSLHDPTLISSPTLRIMRLRRVAGWPRRRRRLDGRGACVVIIMNLSEAAELRSDQRYRRRRLPRPGRRRIKVETVGDTSKTQAVAVTRAPRMLKRLPRSLKMPAWNPQPPLRRIRTRRQLLLPLPVQRLDADVRLVENRETNSSRLCTQRKVILQHPIQQGHFRLIAVDQLVSVLGGSAVPSWVQGDQSVHSRSRKVEAVAKRAW